MIQKQNKEEKGKEQVLSERQMLSEEQVHNEELVLSEEQMPKEEEYKEAIYYEKKDGFVNCTLCPHNCILKNNQTGICRVRKNINGKLYSMVYGRPCSISIDPIEKKPLFHFMPGKTAFSFSTAGCNLRCLNCQNWEISQASYDEFPADYISPEELVESAKSFNSEIIAYTYTEPTVFYEYMYDTAKLSKSEGIKNVVVSNGYINEKPLRALCKLVDAANIDLKAFDSKVLMKLTSAKLENVLRTLKIYKEEGVWLEITFLIIPTYTDDLNKIEELSAWIVKNLGESTPFHLSRFFPSYKLTSLPPTPIETLIRARELAMKKGLQYVYIGNLPMESLDEGYENTICPNCHKPVIERFGFEIRSNNIKEGKCPFCGQPIEGVWK